MDSLDPLARPIEVLLRSLSVLVDIVLVANVERRIGEDEIDAACVQLLHGLNAVELVNRVEIEQVRSLRARETECERS